MFIPKVFFVLLTAAFLSSVFVVGSQLVAQQEPLPVLDRLCAGPRLVECGPIEESETCDTDGIGCLFSQQLQIWYCSETFVVEGSGAHIPTIDVHATEKFWMEPSGEKIRCFTTHTCDCSQTVANPFLCETLLSTHLDIQPYVGWGEGCEDF